MGGIGVQGKPGSLNLQDLNRGVEACRNAVDCVRDIGIPPGRIAARRLLEAVHLLMSLRSSVSSGDWEGVHDLIGETVNPLLMERRKKVEALNREDEKKQESSHGRTGTFVELNFAENATAAAVAADNDDNDTAAKSSDDDVNVDNIKTVDDPDINQWLQKKRRKSQQKDMWLNVIEIGKKVEEEMSRPMNLSQLDNLESLMIELRRPNVGYQLRREVSLVRGEIQNRMALVAMSNAVRTGMASGKLGELDCSTVVTSELEEAIELTKSIVKQKNEELVDHERRTKERKIKVIAASKRRNEAAGKREEYNSSSSSSSSSGSSV